MTDETIGTAVVRRRIGRTLEGLRDRAALSQQEAADALQRGRATISRIESGDERVRFRDVDVNQMLDLYNATEAERKELLGLAAETRNGRRKSWWHDYTMTALPTWFVMYVTLEDSADVIRQYEPELVPGLLQTESYAELVIGTPGVSDDEQERQRRVKIRMERQSLLTRGRAPRLEVVLNEAAIYRIIGAGPLARAQLQHLLDVSRQSNVELRILPFAAGIHAGMSSTGGFSMLSFPIDPRSNEPIEPDLIYIESPTGAMYLTKDTEVTIYQRIWAGLTSDALDPQASQQVITNALEGLPQ